MYRQILLRVILFSLLLLDPTAWSSTVNPMVLVPLDSPVYALLDRLATMGAIPLTHKSLPLSRGEIYRLLMAAGENLEDELESSRTERFLRLYSPQDEHNPYIWHLYKEDHSFELDLGLRGEMNDKAFMLDSFGSAWGQVGEIMAFGDDVRSAMIWGEAEELPYASSQTTVLKSEQISVSAINAYAIFNLSPFRLEIGRDKARWGPGRWGALTLSDNSPSMDMAKLTGTFDPFTFTFLVARLRDKERKYLTAHRLEGRLRPWLTLAVSEVGISLRRLDVGYLNPFLIYFVSEEGGEEDKLHNRVISFDGQIRPMKGVRLWGELMVDDFQPSLGFWHPGTKFGILAGMQIAPPLIPGTDLTLEYAFVNQFAYTSTSVETLPSKAYTHAGYVLGHGLGTDSDGLWVRFRYFLNDLISAHIAYRLERHGEGKVDRPFDPRQDKRWDFLSGVVETRNEISAGASYDMIGRCSAEIEGSYSWRRNVDNVRDKEERGVEVKVGGFYRF
jgi:hypothetical protein